MADNVRIRLLLQDLAFGGTQRQALELAARLDSGHFDTRVWTLIRGRGFEQEAEDRGIPVHHLSQGSTVGVRCLWSLFRAIRREKPQVLVLLTVVPNIWGRILGRLCRVPVIIANSRQSGNPGRQHESLLKGLAHHHICNAHALKRQLVDDFGVRAERITVIHNGVDSSRYALPDREPSGPPRIVSLARLVRDKDQATLVRAFAAVAEKHPEAELAIHGDGPLKEELEGLAASLGAGDRVSILPAVPDVAPVLGRSVIFAMSSLREGFPNVIAEAMAMGLPVVSTGVDGVPELVRDGETGLLCGPGDVQSLARGLDSLLSDPAGARAMGRKGRQRVVDDFSFDAMARAHAGLFLQLLAAREGE